MDICVSDRVMVNLAPFIGSNVSSRQWIPCTVRDVDGDQVLVQAEPPHRAVELWVALPWIAPGVDPEADEELLSSTAS
jgi:hypothetical protein